MSNYDVLDGFIDYVNKEEWKNYLENQVLPLWKHAFILKEFFENLKREFQNILVHDIDEKSLPPNHPPGSFVCPQPLCSLHKEFILVC